METTEIKSKILLFVNVAVANNTTAVCPSDVPNPKENSLMKMRKTIRMVTPT